MTEESLGLCGLLPYPDVWYDGCTLPLCTHFHPSFPRSNFTSRLISYHTIWNLTHIMFSSFLNITLWLRLFLPHLQPLSQSIMSTIKNCVFRLYTYSQNFPVATNYPKTLSLKHPIFHKMLGYLYKFNCHFNDLSNLHYLQWSWSLWFCPTGNSSIEHTGGINMCTFTRLWELLTLKRKGKW